MGMVQDDTESPNGWQS